MVAGGEGLPRATCTGALCSLPWWTELPSPLGGDGASFSHVSGLGQMSRGSRLGLSGPLLALGPLSGAHRLVGGEGPPGWRLCCGWVPCGWRASGTGPSTCLQGLFDNFLRLRLRDSSLGAVCTALDWLAFDDLLGRAALHGQSFQLMRYLPFLLPAFHLLFASSHVPRIAFPSSQQEVRLVPCPGPGSSPGSWVTRSWSTLHPRPRIA